MSNPEPLRARNRHQLLKTMECSQKEAVASSAMTATCDNFMNAFALYLQATSIQMGFLTAFPQLLGSLMQLVSVWLGTYLTRRRIVLFTAILQTGLMFCLAVLALMRQADVVQTLIFLVMLYHASSHLIQPQWRAWMGSIVPQKQRGIFFASRSRLTMAATLLVFLGGGSVLSLSDHFGLPAAGFFFLFLLATGGRATSCYFLWKMHDPEPQPLIAEANVFFATLSHIKLAMRDSTFRNYSFFVAGMQGMVAISGPFFAVYMLNELDFTYLQYTLNLVASIATQFFMLRYWGKISDKHGNRLIMLVCSAAMPIIPVLWLFSPNFYYLIGVQVVSGLAWSGFNLTTANYLYDIRPHHTNFATYAAVQAGISAVLVFCGAIFGGYLASAAPWLASWLPFEIGSALFIVFVMSGLLRLWVLLWFIPRAEEPQIRTRPELLQIIFRIARYNSISGVVLDWMTVTEKEPPKT
ncbi:MAG: MFS transporter [Pseudomonadota bacterium]